MKQVLFRYLLVSTLLLSGAAAAQTWTLEPIETRTTVDGQRVQVNLATLESSSAARHVLVAPHPSGTTALRAGAADVIAGGPWARGAVALAQHGIALVYADVPSDAAGRTLSQRPQSDVQADLQAAVDAARRRFPDAGVHLGLFASSGVTLEAALRVRGVSRVVVASGAFTDDRNRSMGRADKPILFVHAATAQCDAAPLLEVEQMAAALGQPLVRIGYPRLEVAPGCGRDSQHALRGLEADIAGLVSRWLAGETPPPEIGSTPAHVAWSEQLLHYEAPGLLGKHRLEMTLWLPEGRRPAPVVLFNHGDVELDHPAMRFKRRIREMTVAREFLRMGLAVAMPARRGVAMSEGTYPRDFRAIDGDPTYKARVHAEDLLPALELLRSRPDIDAKRIVLAGQSAGGYSATYVAGLQPDGVVGVVNFSGGRTDSTASSGPGYLNKMMVEGFAELGRAVKVPVLLVFAEGDSRYSVQTIRASHDAFVASGGRARLVLAPPIGRDGHQVHLVPDRWRGELLAFLGQHEVMRGPHAGVLK